MTTTSPPPVRRAASPGRVLAIVSSVLLLAIGGCLVLAGVALMALFGTDGEISSAKNPVTSPTAAVITDVAAIRDTSDVAAALGTPVATFAADGGNASGLFIGVGRVSDVDKYLAGVAVDQAVDFELDPYVLTLVPREGAQATAAPPGQQNFWVASATGPAPDLRWTIQDGNYRMVIMNADGAAGLNSSLSIGVGLGSLFAVSLGMLIGGAVLILLAVALLVATRPRPPAAVPAGLPGQAPFQQPPDQAVPAQQAPSRPAAPRSDQAPPERVPSADPPPTREPLA